MSHANPLRRHYAAEQNARQDERTPWWFIPAWLAILTFAAGCYFILLMGALNIFRAWAGI